MLLKFYKYEGTGNDFILIDDRKKKFNTKDSGLISRLCNRRTGIGADGLILLRTSSKGLLKMIYFNSDGKESSFCGNGGRCFVHFCHYLGLIKRSCNFKATDGIHYAELLGDVVKLKMRDRPSITKAINYYLIDTGSPHYIRFIDKNPSSVDLIKFGRKIRYSSTFRKYGVNVNLVQIQKDNSLKMRTYERGVEDETLSCGTGVTAVVIALAEVKMITSPILVNTKGGELWVYFIKLRKNVYNNIFLKGNCNLVYSGIVFADNLSEIQKKSGISA